MVLAVHAHRRRSDHGKARGTLDAVGDPHPQRPSPSSQAVHGFKRRDTPGAERELKRVQAKAGELTMKLEIVEWFLEKKGYGEELKKLKRSGEL